MIAGMYVVRGGVPMQVVSISHMPVRGGAPRITYGLVCLDGGPLEPVVDPTADDMPLTAACGQCGRPAGFGVCVERGACVGPVPAPKDRPLPAHWPTVCGCGQCPECYSARQGQRVLSR